MTNLSVSDLVKKGSDGQLKTTSLIVAARFGKEHKDVLRAVENLECSQEFNERNFAPIDYTDRRGRKQRAFEMTRDGFMFLAMGFTGSAAAEWKEKFIAAFNQMERTLIEQQRQAFALPPDLIEQQRRTDHALAMLADCQRQFHGETMGRFDIIENRLDQLEEHARATSKRCQFGSPVLREWNAVLVMRYGGQCPCCQNVRIVDAFGRPLDGVYEADHWRSPAHNKVGDGWPVCTSCNRETLERDRLSKQYAFQHFHDLRKSIFRRDDQGVLQLALPSFFEDAA